MELLSTNTYHLFSAILFLSVICCLGAQDHPPQPSLTVSPAVIRERETVMLSCDIPPFLSVDKCYFIYGYWKELHSQNPPCHQWVTGTAILSLTGQRLPAQVKLQCYYKANGWRFNSLHSAFASVTITDQPSMTVRPAVVRETDSVQLICETPPSLSGSQCYIDIEGRQNLLHSCQQSLPGTTLLSLTGQSSPAEVKVRCNYNSVGMSTMSPFSDPVSVIIQGPKPVVTVDRGENILITCSLPGSASSGTRCSLYMGEEETPFKTTQVSENKSKKHQQWYCQFSVSKTDLLRRLQSVSRKEVSCDYRVSPEQSSAKSPRSDGYILTDLMVDDSSDLNTTLATSTTSDLMVDDSSDLTTTQTTSTTSGLTDDTTSPSGTTESRAAEPHQSTRVFCTSGSYVSYTLPPDSRWFPNTGKSHSKRPADNR